jgi:NADH:ubiquinone oxidoreductase subunit E
MAVIKLSESKINFVKDICKSFNNEAGEVINVLHKVQGEFGYLSAEVQELVAEELHIPVARVYGIVSFYSFFTMTPKGRYPISVCLGTACYLKGGQDLIDEARSILGLDADKISTDDGLFSVEPVRCIGCCGLAPVLSVNGDVYGKLTKSQIAGILDKYRDA